MMTLNEYLKGVNLFQIMKQINPDLPFLNDGNVERLDSLLKLQHGERPIFSKIIQHDLELVAGFLINLYGDNWVRLVELNALATELAGGEVRTITENIDNTENRNNESENVNKVSGYNSDDLIVDDGSSSQSNDVVTGLKTRTLTDKTQNLTSLYNSLSLSHKNNIMNVVLKDVKDFLTLSIY